MQEVQLYVSFFSGSSKACIDSDTCIDGVDGEKFP